MDFDALKKLLEGANNMAQKPQNMSVGEPAQVPEAIEEAATDASLEQINDVAKSPNMKTQPELQQAEMEQQADRTVAGQLSENSPEKDMMQRMRENISRYEQKVDTPAPDKGWNGAKLQDAFSGLHNVLNYGSGSLQKNLSTDARAKEAKMDTDKRKEDFGRLQELQKLYSDYQGKLKKTDDKAMTAYQKAQIEQRKADRDLKEKLAKSDKKNKKKTVTKFQEKKEVNAAERFADLEEAVPNTLSSIEEANFIKNEIEEGRLNTGPGSKLAGSFGSFFGTEESSLKERLDSLAEKAARAQLKANGETRPTDADVEGMKRAMFNLGNTEDTNLEKLTDFIKQQQATISEYNQMKELIDRGEGLEDFKLKQTFDPKTKDVKTIKSDEVRRRTKDGKTAIFNAETKEFIRYE